MKRKGVNAERELVQMLAGSGWAAIRVAGSGSSKFPSPDILASNGSRVLAIECKSTKSKYQYIDTSQLNQLTEFARTFNAEPWIAVKFSSNWRFFRPEDLSKTKRRFGITSDDKHAKFFSDLTR